MTLESLFIKDGDESAPLRQAAFEEVLMRRFGGVGPPHPGITWVAIGYTDPRERPEPVDPVNDISPNQMLE